MKNVAVINQNRPLTSKLLAGYCSSFRCRLRGLTFRKSLPPDWGLLLVQSQESRADAAIHMFFVFINLGIVWIDDLGIVVDRCVAKKWVTIKAPKTPARYILEIVPDRLDEFQIGDQINFEN